MDSTKNLVPLFITGSSKEELVKKMLKYNMLTGAFHNVINIYKDGNEHVCWFYENVEMRIKDIKDEEDK